MKNYTRRYHWSLIKGGLIYGLLTSPVILIVLEDDLSWPAILYKLALTVPVLSVTYALGHFLFMRPTRVSLPPAAAEHLRQDLHRLGYRPLQPSAVTGTYAVPGTNGQTVLSTIEVEREVDGRLRVQGPTSQLRELEKLWESGERKLEAGNGRSEIEEKVNGSR